MRKRRTNITPYGFYFVLLILTWNRETLLQYAKSVLWRIPGVSYCTTIIIAAVFVSLIVLSWNYMRSRVRYTDVGLYLLFCFVYIIEILIGVDSEDYLVENIYVILIQIIPAYFIGVCIDENDSNIYKYVHITSFLSIYLHLVNAFVIGTNEINEVMDAMDLSYRILPHVCFILYAYFKERKMPDLITLLIGFISLIWFGSRGAFILALAFAVFYYIFIKEHRHKIIIYVLVGAIFSAFAYYSDYIFLFIRNLLASMGIKTRIFDRIVEHTFFQSVGRTSINDILINAIKEHPLFGYGIAGDRPLCYRIGEVYAHNIALEMWISYGGVIGTIFLVITLYTIIKAIIKTKNNDVRAIILSFTFGAGLLKLFISNSYLMEYEFFLNLGICIAVLRNVRQETTRTIM